jgi:hypothetical protein
MRRFALIVLLSVFASFLGLDGPGAATTSHAAFPGSNGKLLVRIPTFNRPQLASVEPDGSDFRIVGDGFYGSWSPDGSKIVFDTQGVGGSPIDISIMDADGSHATPVLTGPTYDVLPTWSPDGERITFISDRAGGTGESTVAVYTAKADGTGLVQLTDPGQIAILTVGSPKWSPDGSKIIFSGQEPALGGWEVYSVPAAGGAVTRLSNTGGRGAYVEWSPDGSKIAFGNGQDIWVMSAGGGGATKIATIAVGSRAGAGTPVWSPEGERIAYTEAPGYVPAYASYIMDASGGNKQAIPVSGMILDWQPVPATKVEFTQAIQELQSISQLQDDLKGDGKPPVPIVAGKPAAMRVLFDEVDAAVTYRVEVSGEFTEDETVTLTPGCTQEERRKQEAGCKSVDFYFTPPEDNWSVTLKVKEAGTVVEEHEFNLTSEKTDAIVLKAVDVCHARATLLGPWTCQSANSLVALASHLRKVAPTDSVSVVLGGHQVRRRVSDYVNAGDWMDDAIDDIDALYTPIDAGVAGQDVYYFGLSDPLAGGYNGIAVSPGHGGLSRAFVSTRGQVTTGATIAHEVGHLMGRDHTGVAEPAADCWDSEADLPREWPYADNMLRSGPAPGAIEVGFDVAEQKALPGDENFEMMGYCVPRWISPHTTVKLLDPAGPLAPARVPASEVGPFWLVGGDITDTGVQFRPLFARETEGSTDEGSGTYRIEAQNAGGAPLFTRAFAPITASPDLPPDAPAYESDPFFSELIPVQPGGARIVIIDGQDAEIGAITLGGAAPTVTITQAANDGQVVSLEWSVDDPDSTGHTYWVDYSPDGGATWQNQAMGLADAALVLDAATLAGSGNSLFRVIASDGVNSGEAVSEPFSESKKLPHGEIIGPSGGSFREGSLIWLEAAAWDVDDGTLDGGAVTWASSRDGALGSGASLPVYDLSIGTHTITMTGKDSDNNAVTDSITVTVFDDPIIEGQAGLSGDVDCSGGVNAVDALKLLRQVAGMPVAQTQPCPVIGAGDASIFGDINCDGNITAVDTLFVLRFVAGMPVNLPQGCRPVGT